MSGKACNGEDILAEKYKREVEPPTSDMPTQDKLVNSNQFGAKCINDSAKIMEREFGNVHP